MNDIQFGVFLNPSRSRATQIVDNTLAAENSGFDFVSIQDHPYVGGLLDPLALIGTLMGRTSRIRFLTDVVNLPSRPPAVLAKTSATLDIMSAGRFELGLGGGRAWDGIAALGGPRWAPGEIVRSVDEAMTIARYFWQGRTEGLDDLRMYSLGEIAPGPAPAHPIGIWLGAAGPRMLDLLGRRADGWIAPLGTGFDTKLAAQDRIDREAIAAGRQPQEVRRTIQLVGSVTESPITANRHLSGPGTQAVRTDPAGWARIIREHIDEERFDTINFIPEQETPGQVAAFGQAVIPLVRTE